MTIHVFQRATTHGLIAFLGVGTAIAAVAKEANDRQVAPWEVVLLLGGFLVAFLGALTLAWVRWLGKVSKNVPRDPVRVEEHMRHLTERINRLDRRLARMEGYVNQPVIFREGRDD